MNQRHILVAGFLLAAATLACNRTVPTATYQPVTPVPTAAGQPGTPVLPTEALSPTESPSTVRDTPAPLTSTPIAEASDCTFDADFVADVTIPDDTQLEANTVFVKTWRLLNSGNCAWEAGTLWQFDSGDSMGSSQSTPVPGTEPGATVDISLNLTAPAEPGTYAGYWRLQRPSGEAFGTRGFVRIVIADGTATSTPGETPTATGEPGVGPVIQFFMGSVDEADPGDAVTLEWGTEGATSVTLYHLMPTGQLGTFWDVALSGDFEYEIDPAERNHSGFLLVASDDQGNTSRASFTVALRCPDTWFFEPPPDACPANAAIVSDGAEQRFENGVMIWVLEEDTIYVLFDDGHSPWWRALADEWEPGDPENDPEISPPDGFHQPERGFGLVWRERLGVRDRLGWATAPETAYQTAVQRTSRAKYNDTFIRSLDSKVWKLLPESSGWEELP